MFDLSEEDIQYRNGANMFNSFGRARFLPALCLVGMIMGCGGDSQPSSQKAASSDCPPVSKPGLSAIQRAGGLESLEKYGKWQTELPPKSCAGGLASYIPDLPEGYGLPPSTRPPIMNDNHVYLKYVEIPENVTGDALDLINFAQQPQFEFEIARISDQEKEVFDDWFTKNPKSYSEYVAGGRRFYALGGGGWYMKGHRLTGGIGVILDNNVMIKFTMPRIYADTEVARPTALMFHEIAVKNGQ